MQRTLVLALALVGVLISAPALAGSVKITIVSAKINAKKLPKKSRSRADTPYSDLACYALPGLRKMAASCGVHMAADGVTVVPTKPLPERAQVDPMVRLVMGDFVVRTYPVPSTLKPQWEYSAVFDEAALKKAGKKAKFILYDWVSAEKEVPLARGRIEMSKLLKPGTRTIRLGPAKIKYRVEALSATPRIYEYEVPATRQIADLARDAATTQKAGEYMAVPVAEGETVQIEASGKVQPNAKKYPKRKAGPEGIPTISTKVQYNQPGFRKGENHAALILQLGTTSMMVGKSKTFTASTAGLLILAINDLKTADNGGAFKVKVTVKAPGKAAPKRRGTDKGPSSLSPRVVQQIVDSRAQDFGPCFAKTKDPNGDVTLQFLITSDGRPVVSVAAASPSLKAVAECMAGLATKWTFPRPRGTVVVRYPMHLSTQ